MHVRTMNEILREAALNVMKHELGEPLLWPHYDKSYFIIYLNFCQVAQILAPRIYFSLQDEIEEAKHIEMLLERMHWLHPEAPLALLAEVLLPLYIAEVKQILTEPDVKEMVLKEAIRIAVDKIRLDRRNLM